MTPDTISISALRRLGVVVVELVSDEPGRSEAALWRALQRWHSGTGPEPAPPIYALVDGAPRRVVLR